MGDEEVRLTYGKEGLVAADLGQYASLKNETGNFPETTAFEGSAVITSEKANMHA